MASFFNRLKRATQAAFEKDGPEKYHILCRPVVCTRCGHDNFKTGQAQLNTATMSFLDLDWMNESVSLLICTTCSKIEWYGHPPEKMISSNHA